MIPKFTVNQHSALHYAQANLLTDESIKQMAIAHGAPPEEVANMSKEDLNFLRNQFYKGYNGSTKLIENTVNKKITKYVSKVEAKRAKEGKKDETPKSSYTQSAMDKEFETLKALKELAKNAQNAEMRKSYEDLIESSKQQIKNLSEIKKGMSRLNISDEPSDPEIEEAIEKGIEKGFNRGVDKLQEKCSGCNKTPIELGMDGALLKCGRCREAMYCSAVCQKSDWKHHKISCKPKETPILEETVD